MPLTRDFQQVLLQSHALWVPLSWILEENTWTSQILVCKSHIVSHVLLQVALELGVVHPWGCQSLQLNLAIQLSKS